MTSSGIKIADECVRIFEDDLKLKKKHQYIIFRISEDHQCIEVESMGEKGETFDDFKTKITQGNARFAVLDYSTEKDGKGGTLGFIFWVNDECNIRYKMMYASSKDILKKKLPGVQAEWQIHGLEEFLEEDVPPKMKK